MILRNHDFFVYIYIDICTFFLNFFSFITIINRNFNFFKLKLFTSYLLKLSVKSDKEDARTPCLVTWGDEF
jgi:hypothetical protein